MTPLDNRAVIMRMGKCESRYATHFLDFRDSDIINERDAVPEQIERWRLDNMGTLSDAESGFDDHTGQSENERRKDIMMLRAYLFECCPGLPVQADVLALVLTNDASIG